MPCACSNLLCFIAEPDLKEVAFDLTFRHILQLLLVFTKKKVFFHSLENRKKGDSI